MKISMIYNVTIEGDELHNMVRQFIADELGCDFNPKNTTVEVIADSPALNRIEAILTVTEGKD